VTLQPAILAGPDPGAGFEPAASHLARLGPRPRPGADLIRVLERSGLRGRGGAGFPVGVKWRSVAARPRGSAVVLANGAEGEPLSAKDALVMETRPHLVLDGAVLAAEAVGADRVVLYVGASHAQALESVSRAVAERPLVERHLLELVRAPRGYVSGEESAAVHFVNRGVARPTAVPPRPFERGVGGRPTLVQNVETLAHVGLIARRGDAWFRDLGRTGSAGTVLVTVGGAVPARRVVELPQGSSVGEAMESAGCSASGSEAVLLGGYFGGFIGAPEAWGLRLDPEELSARGQRLGCGVISALPPGACGVTETARVVSYLADQSAGQCGPCVFGLHAIAAALRRIASMRSVDHDLPRLRRWVGEVPGRGACRHPDGAAGLVGSALSVFPEEFDLHQGRRRCSARGVLLAGAA
jgi:NADH:ubiquinone oxidoreductase subunit F (NADH-binding)